MSKYKKIFVALFGFMVVVSAHAAFAQSVPGIDEKANCSNFASQFVAKLNNGKSFDTVATLPKFCSLTELATKVINFGLVLAGTAAVLFIILGGYWKLTSAGNEEQAEKGTKVLTNSVIGLVVIVMSFAIVRIVTNLLTSNAGTATTNSTTNNNGSQNNNGGINTTPNYEPGSPGDPNYVSNLVSGSGQPAELNISQSYDLTLIIPESLLSCGKTASSAYVKVTRADGSTATVQPYSFGKGSGTSYVAKFETGTPSSYGYRPTGLETSRSEIQMPITGYVCGMAAYQSAVNVLALTANNDTGSSPRGSVSQELQNAIKQAKFTVTTNSTDKTFTIYVFGGTSNNVKVLCTDAAEAGIRVTAANIKGGANLSDMVSTSVLDSVRAGMSAPVKSGIPVITYDPNSVRVFICGNEISK